MPLPQDSFKPSAVTDFPCEKCGHPMLLRCTSDGEQWFYGCSQFPYCRYTFDADQVSGAPISHTRHGIPIRGVRREGAGLFEALKKDQFSPLAGQRLEQAKKKGAARRQRDFKKMELASIKERLKQTNPKSPEEWLEFVLAERLQAFEDFRRELGRKIQLGEQKMRVKRKPLASGI